MPIHWRYRRFPLSHHYDIFAQTGIGFTGLIFSICSWSPILSTYIIITHCTYYITYHILTWQLSCSGACQIWMWFKGSNYTLQNQIKLHTCTCISLIAWDIPPPLVSHGVSFVNISEKNINVIKRFLCVPPSLLTSISYLLGLIPCRSNSRAIWSQAYLMARGSNVYGPSRPYIVFRKLVSFLPRIFLQVINNRLKHFVNLNNSLNWIQSKAYNKTNSSEIFR